MADIIIDSRRGDAIAIKCLGFRVVAVVDGVYVADDFELAQAAIECARRVHAAGNEVVACHALEQDGRGHVEPNPLRWEAS